MMFVNKILKCGAETRRSLMRLHLTSVVLHGAIIYYDRCVRRGDVDTRESRMENRN